MATPYIHHDANRVRLEARHTTPIHKVAAAAPLLKAIESFDANQLYQGTRIFVGRYVDKHSVAFAVDFIAGDIHFRIVVLNALLRDDLFDSALDLLDVDTAENDKRFVTTLQLGTSLLSRQQFTNFTACTIQLTQ